MVSPVVWDSSDNGYPATSHYVRTFWTAALGPGAVADLLRLATAASRGRSLRRPLSLSRLCAAGLAREHDGRLEVRTVIPPLTPTQVKSLHPSIRRLHDAYQHEDLPEMPPAA